MTLERKILIGLGLALLIAINFIVWQQIPTKTDPLLKLENERLEETLEKSEEEKELLYQGLEMKQSILIAMINI